MSLYNQLFGQNPLAGMLLGMLGLEHHQVARYRDCFMVRNGEKIEIAIHTRIGGTNRELYHQEITQLRGIEGYLRDEDDTLDHTFATFFYRVPESSRLAIDQLVTRSGINKDTLFPPLPRERWTQLVGEMAQGKDTEETRRLKDAAEKIQEAITAGKRIIEL